MNQGIRHFFDYWRDTPDRLVGIATRLGIDVQMISPSRAGFSKFTELALNIANNYERLGGSMRTFESGKTVYWFSNVIVIMFNGKLQSMMPGTMKSFLSMK